MNNSQEFLKGRIAEIERWIRVYETVVAHMRTATNATDTFTYRAASRMLDEFWARHKDLRRQLKDFRADT